MKLQQTPNLQLQRKRQNEISQNKSNPSFKGGAALAQVLNFLDTNFVVGASAVDAGSMGLPRTAIDFSRGPAAGMETARREFSSTINDAALGLYGLGAAMILARGFNNKFGVNATKMFVSDDMIDTLAQMKDRNPENLNGYLNEIFDNAKGFNPHRKGENKYGWVGIGAETRGKVVNILSDEISDKTKENLSEQTKAYLKALIADETGAEKNFILKDANTNLDALFGPNKDKNLKTAESSLDELLEGVHKLSKMFTSETVTQKIGTGNFSGSEFVNELKKLNKTKSIFGISAALGVGLAIQPINMYLTKKKTGNAGFVGGGEEDKSTKFRLTKIAVAAAATIGVLSTLGNPKNLFSKIQFKGLTPTLNQFKFVYGATILSRLLSARNDNELRETSIKDSLGFANWLIFGGFVSKLVASGFEKMDAFKDNKFIRYDKATNGDSKFNWLIKSSLVSREEILREALAEVKEPTTIKVGNVERPLKLKEMMEIAAKKAPKALNKIKYLGFIQMSGYLYSGIVLGAGIPKLNIAITKHFEKKKKAANAEGTTEVKPQAPATSSNTKTAEIQK